MDQRFRGNSHMNNSGYSSGYGRGSHSNNLGSQVNNLEQNQVSGYGRGSHSNNLEQDQTSRAAANQWAAGVRKDHMNQSPWMTNPQILNASVKLQGVWLDDRLINKKDKAMAIHASLVDALRLQANPWEAALYLFTHANDYPNAKPASLSFQILVEFQKWVSSRESAQWESMEHILTQDLRIRVFQATTGKHISFFNFAVKAYGLDHIGNDYFLPAAKDLLRTGKLTEGAQVIGRLGLQSHFSQEEVLMPLLFTDKVNVLESYVTGSPDQQRVILELLDHLCARSTDILAFARSAGIKNIKGEKLSKKVLSKFAMRLIKLFDIPPETCPNITENRAMGAVRYLLYKYYIEKSMTHDSWSDMLESAVGETANLHQQLVTELLGYNDVAEALLWADRFSLDDAVLESTVVEARRQQRLAEQQLSSLPPAESDQGYIVTEDWDAEAATYYTMPLAYTAITMVTDKQGLEECLHRITQPLTTMGIDAEWKPSMGKAPQVVALLQLAVAERVFLVDCVSLRDVLEPGDWAALGHALFCDQNTVKIGFGLGTDLRMLTLSFPSMHDAVQRMVRVVDLEKLAKMVFADYDASMLDNQQPPSGTSGGSGWSQAALQKKEEKGLSLLCMKTLGKPLSKTEQMSNWEKRPLRHTQVTYAAADAYVLLDIHSKLLALGHKIGVVDLEPPVTVSMKTRMDKKKARAARESRRRQHINRGGFAVVGQPGPVSPKDLRVVCDTMLQGLGSQLRTCGVDTYIMGSSLRHTDAIQISKHENRYVLTTKGPYDHIRANVGESMCFCVDCSKNARDQCLDVLRYFKVKVNKEDIFSRCCLCNSAEFAFLPSADMESLFMFNLQRQQQNVMGHPPSLYEVDPGTRSRFLRHNIDPATITFLHNRVRIQVETVPKQEVFGTIEEFFVCATCGKVYWEGSHHERVLTQFENILKLNSDESQLEEVTDKEEGIDREEDDESEEEDEAARSHSSAEGATGGL